jgi:hypothetical protein
MRPISLAHSIIVESVQFSGNKLECQVDVQITIVTLNCRGTLIGLQICLNLIINDLNMQLVM